MPAVDPCKHCQRPPTTRETVVLGRPYYEIVCDNCYDGAPDSTSRGDYGSGFDLASAQRHWNNLQEDLPQESTEVQDG